MIRTPTPWWLPGALLMLVGTLIVLFPELLALMVASAFIVMGAVWLSVAHSERKLHRRSTRFFISEQWWPW